MAYGVVRTDNMMGTDVSTYLDSVRYFTTTTTANDTPTAIENGNVVKVGALLDGERELHLATAPAVNTPLKEIGLVATPEVMYDERKHNLDEFRNEAGANVRIYYLHDGDEFGITADCFTAAADVAVGDVVELQASTKLKVVAAGTGATSGSTVVGKIIAIESTKRYTYYVVRVG